MSKNYESKIINGNISFWKFNQHTKEVDYEDAFESYVKTISMPNVKKLITIIEQKGDWNNTIETVWVKTAELAEEQNIEKWGIVTPDSIIWEMTLKRISQHGSATAKTNYEIKISKEEEEVLQWIQE